MGSSAPVAAGEPGNRHADRIHRNSHAVPHVAPDRRAALRDGLLPRPVGNRRTSMGGARRSRTNCVILSPCRAGVLGAEKHWDATFVVVCASLQESSDTGMQRPETNRDLYPLLAVITAIIGVVTLYFARSVLMPLALAVLFTFLLTPPVGWLERIRLGRIFSALIVVTLAVAALGAIGWTVAKQLVDVTNQLPNYR